MLKKKRFLINAILLTATSLLLRTLGMTLRVYTAGEVGPQGMGLYQLILSVYSFCITLSSSGLSVAVTRLVAAKPALSSKILRRAVLLGLGIALPTAAALFTFAAPISQYCIGDLRAAAALKILPLSLPCIAVTSCIGGYFLARRKVVKSCAAQITEQMIRISATIFLLGLVPLSSLELSCCALVLGTVLSELISALLCYFLYKIDSKALNKTGESPAVLRPLLRIAGPLALTAWLRSALFTLENLLIPRGFAKHMGSGSGAIAQYGMLKGMAIPVLFFPAAFLTAVSRLLIPEITEAAVHKQEKNLCAAVSRALQFTFVASIFFGTVFFVFSDSIAIAVYKNAQSAYLLFVLAPLVPFMYVETMADGLLKGLNLQVYSLRYNLFDSLVRIALIYWLLPIFGLKGFLFVLYCSNIFCCLFSFGKLVSVVGLRPRLADWMVKPLLASSISCVLMLAVCKKLSSLMICLVAIPCAAGLFLTLLFLLRAVSPQDFQFLRPPKK